uniref:protein-tyrosine-phosphatase n=1 Tax=Otolemur garnettii TaxID=30611 RepID=H0XV78_OTOGA
MVGGSGPQCGCDYGSPLASKALYTGQMLEVSRLFAGGAAAVSEQDHLKVAGISALLMVDSGKPSFKAGAEVEGLWGLFVPALDKPETDPLSHLDRCVAFISKDRAEGHAALVHWSLFIGVGVSQSVAIVTAFGITTGSMGYEVDISSTIYKEVSRIAEFTSRTLCC